eukprot:1298738-Pleurochrysis_carterae.AAC.1
MPPVPDTIPDSHSSLSDLSRPASRGLGRSRGGLRRGGGGCSRESRRRSRGSAHITSAPQQPTAE